MTMASLEAWAAATGQSREEKKERATVVKRLTIKEIFKERALKEIDDLILNDMRNLTSLPEGLSVRGRFILSGCTSLSQLPERLLVAGCFTLSGCTSLTQLPEGLILGGPLYLCNCTSLTRLPEGLSIAGRLDLGGCTALAHLPESLTVTGFLNLGGCTALTQVPDGLSVGDSMNLSRCTSLTQLPSQILQWPLQRGGYRHRILLTGSGIREEEAHALGQIAGPGVQLIHDVQENRATDGARFANLPAAMAFWRPLATPGARGAAPDGAPAPVVHGDPQQLLSFLDFLGRLRGTADYQNVKSRPLLAQRIVGLLDQVAASESLAALCHERIGQALESCGDRVIWAMNQLELTVRVHQAQQGSTPKQALRDLGRSLLRLQVVHQHAAAKVVSLTVVDPIEVYLAYETKLAQPLGLPLFTQGMLYERSSHVTKADLEAASRAAKQADADSQQVELFLQSWEPWQGLIRRQYAEGCTWQGLPHLPQEAQLDDDQMCILTQETVAELRASGTHVAAVRDARGQWEPYAFAPLLEWWAQQGTHPVQRTPMGLKDMRRMDDPLP
jgi:hypothetical protein